VHTPSALDQILWIVDAGKVQSNPVPAQSVPRNCALLGHSLVSHACARGASNLSAIRSQDRCVPLGVFANTVFLCGLSLLQSPARQDIGAGGASEVLRQSTGTEASPFVRTNSRPNWGVGLR
jgi:hypothetical protein